MDRRKTIISGYAGFKLSKARILVEGTRPGMAASIRLPDNMSRLFPYINAILAVGDG